MNNMDLNKLEVIHASDRKKFYAIINNKEAFLKYRKVGPTMLEYFETFVPVDERNQGIATKITDEAMRYAQLNNYLVIDTCPFVADFIDQHHKYEKIRVDAKEKKYYQSLP